MKRILVFGLMTAVLVIMGCGKADTGKSPSSNFWTEKIEGEISISAYESRLYRNFLEQAARAFEEQYPGTKVRVETFSAMPEVRNAEQGNTRMSMVQAENDPQGRTDYISRVNTGLMSGGGADLFAMDILPLQQFAANGTLENLDLCMTADSGFNRNDYRGNILDALRYRDGTWILPLDYTFNYYAYDATLFPAGHQASFGPDRAFNMNELFQIGLPLFTGSHKIFNLTDYSPGRGPGGMFYQLLNETLYSWVDLEKGRTNFVDGGFAALLESVRNYGEGGYIPRGITGQQDAGQIMRRASMEESDRYFFKLNSNFSLVSQFSRGTGQRMRMQTEGSAGGNEDNDEIAGIQANLDGSIPFKYNLGFGLNSQSKNKAAAWAFLKFLLSQEMQLSTALPAAGLPLHNKAREEKGELLFSGAFMGMGRPLNDQQRQGLENYRTAVETMAGKINSYQIQDTALNDMITAEVQYFFNGSRTTQEVSRVLQNKTDLYLNESAGSR